MIKESTQEPLLSARSLLDDLAGKGIVISLEGERLKISGNKEKMPAGTMERLKERKEELISYIRSSAQEKRITAVEEQEHYPLSHAQKRLWVISQFPAVGAAYNLPQALTIRGIVLPVLFNRAIRQVVEKHESLRTVFIVQHDEPRQRVQSLQRSGFAVNYQDLGASANPGEMVAAIVKECVLSPFDLSSGPLVRVVLLKIAAEEFVLALAIHHIVSDGWSMEVFTRELITAYTALQENDGFSLPPLQVQYRDFTIWQNKRLQHSDTSAYKDYWMKQLGGELPVTDLAWEQQRPAAKTYNGATAQCRVPGSTLAALKKLAEDNGATMFMVMLAAFKILLARYSGKYDVVIGTPGAGRDEALLDQQIGFYVNTLPIRTRFNASDSFIQVLEAVKRSSLGAFGNQFYPFDKLVDDLSLERKVNYSAVFDVMLSFLDDKGFGTGEGDVNDAALEADGIEFSRGTSQFDLSVFFYHEPGFLVARFEYNTDILTAGQVSRMSGHLLQLLEAVTNDYNKETGMLPLFNEETALLLSAAQGSETVNTGTLANAIRSCSEKYAGHAALIGNMGEITYAAMQQNASRVSAYLVSQLNITEGEKIGLFMHASEAFVIAMTGIIQAGGVCVPVSPAYEQEHIQYIINNSGCRIMICDGPVNPEQNGSLVTVDIKEALACTAINNLVPVAGTACWLYGEKTNTRPFLLTQDAVLNAAKSLAEQMGNITSLRMLAGASLNNAASIQQLFAAMLQGAALVFIPVQEHADAKKMLHTLIARQVNIMNVTPPLLQAMLGGLKDHEPLPPLQKVLTETKWLHPELVSEFYKAFGTARLIGTYSTPAYGIVAAAQIPADGWQPLQIGKPIYNTRISIRDASMNLMPAGVTGEIYVSGTGANGSSTEWRKTGELGRWHSDSSIGYIGHNERNIKIQGHSISLQSIARVIMQLPGITQSLVKIYETGKLKNIVLYYTGDILPEKLQAVMGSKLPYYMLPGIVMHIKSFPLTIQGMIDEAALPEPVLKSAPVNGLPADETEQIVMQVWQQVLKHDRFGTTDNFFNAGGHSLKAFQVLSRINEHFKIRVTLTELFNNATVQALSVLVKNAGKSSVEKIQPLEEQAWYAADNRQMKMFSRIQFARNPLPYNITRSFTLSGIQKNIFEKAICALLQKHEALRTSFYFTGEQLYQVVHAADKVSVPMEYFDLRETSANERSAEDIFNGYRDLSFDFSVAPLWRIALVKMKEEIDLVIITMQHIISDGPSLQMLVDDFNELYEQAEQEKPAQLTISPVQLKEYCAWQNKRLKENDAVLVGYWKQKITPSFLNLSVFPGNAEVQTQYRATLDREMEKYSVSLTAQQKSFVYGKIATARPLTGACYCTILPVEDWQQLCALAATLNSGYFNLLTAALSVWVYRLTGKTDVLVGAPVSYRFDERWQPVIGYLVEVLLLPLTVNPQLDFSAAVRSATEVTAESQQHIYPFEQLLDRLDHTIYETGNLLLHLRNIDQTKEIEFPAENLHRHSAYAAPQFKLNLKFDLYKNGLVLYCEYWPGSFTAAQAEYFAEGYITQLKELLQHPGSAVQEYGFITGAQIL